MKVFLALVALLSTTVACAAPAPFPKRIRIPTNHVQRYKLNYHGSVWRVELCRDGSYTAISLDGRSVWHGIWKTADGQVFVRETQTGQTWLEWSASLYNQGSIWMEAE